MNKRIMKCGASLIAEGMENSQADLHAKADMCLFCDLNTNDKTLPCEYRKQYLEYYWLRDEYLMHPAMIKEYGVPQDNP